MLKVLVGDVMEQLATLPDESVQCCVTSPPFYGLRDYGTARWEGGDEDCEHRVGGQVQDSKAPGAITTGQRPGVDASHCRKCGAIRIDSQIGLERTPEDYVNKLVAVFREVRRVLRDDGTLWLNLGDSYAGSWKNQGRKDERGTQRPINGPMLQSFNGHPAPEANAGIVPPGLKPKDLVGIPWRVAFALQADGWWLRSDIIWSKCLGWSTRIYAKTQKGQMPMSIREASRLRPETIQLWSGDKWVNVKSITQTEQTQGYEIEFRNGQRITATAEHRWPIEGLGLLIETSSLQLGMKIKQALLPEPNDRISDGLPDWVGYIIGLFIAEGNFSKKHGVQFSLHAKEDDLAQKLIDFARYFGAVAFVYNYGNNKYIKIHGHVTIGVIREFVNGDGSKHKHLSTSTWQRSNEFLGQLLLGYLHGDGHWEALTNRWKLGFTRNDALADDLRTICARLGYSCRLRRAWHKNQTGKFYGFRGDIVLNAKYRRTSDWEVVNIQRAKGNKFFEVELADDPHLFTLSSGVVTHNSNPMPESVTDRPTKAHEYVFMLSKRERYYWDQDAVREPHDEPWRGNGDPTKREGTSESNRVSFGLGGSTRVRNGTMGNDPAGSERVYNPAGRNIRTVWTIATQPYPEAHFATFPEEIPKRCILAGTSARGCCPKCLAPWERVTEREAILHRPNSDSIRGHSPSSHRAQGAPQQGARSANVTTTGWQPTCSCGLEESTPCTILDPFAGSGTTLKVALELGRQAVGIELNPDYAAMIDRRCKTTLGLPL